MPKEMFGFPRSGGGTQELTEFPIPCIPCRNDYNGLLIFNSPGIYEFTFPRGVISYEMWGNGAQGGGGGYNTGTGQPGGPGGAFIVLQRNVYLVHPTRQLRVVIGATGAAGVSGAVPTAGGGGFNTSVSAIQCNGVDNLAFVQLTGSQGGNPGGASPGTGGQHGTGLFVPVPGVTDAVSSWAYTAVGGEPTAAAGASNDLSFVGSQTMHRWLYGITGMGGTFGDAPQAGVAAQIVIKF